MAGPDARFVLTSPRLAAAAALCEWGMHATESGLCGNCHGLYDAIVWSHGDVADV
jgi:hypothetical protein